MKERKKQLTLKFRPPYFFHFVCFSFSPRFKIHLDKKFGPILTLTYTLSLSLSPLHTHPLSCFHSHARYNVPSPKLSLSLSAYLTLCINATSHSLSLVQTFALLTWSHNLFLGLNGSSCYGKKCPFNIENTCPTKFSRMSKRKKENNTKEAKAIWL